MSDDVARKIRVTGRVQGVWFRGWTVDAATSLGLRGWVRNRRDGSVEALLIGPEAAVHEMIQRCQEGPSTARVDRVAVHHGEDDGSRDFQQVATV